MYIHESLAEYIQCGDTSFLITDAYNKIKDLNKTNDDGKTGFQKEYEVHSIPLTLAIYLLLVTERTD